MSDPRRSLRVYLAENGLTLTDLAASVGVTPNHLSAAICAERPTFCQWRYRMRVERAVKVALWTFAAEAGELTGLSARIGADVITAPVIQLRAALRAASGGRFDDTRGGFSLLRAGLLWMNPKSKAARLPHYEN